MTTLPRLRQAVLAARELDPVAATLRRRLGLGEPYADPGVEHFGLRNAVFALGDTFLEVVSPIRPDTAAGRLIERRGGDSGYMVMFQVADLEDARRRVQDQGVREVFEVSFPDIAEVHLHPADMRAAIVSLSQTLPSEAWRWGGPDWRERSAAVRLVGATIAVADAGVVRARWDAVLGTSSAQAGIRFAQDAAEPGLVEVVLAGLEGDPFSAGGVRFSFQDQAQEDAE